MTEQVQKQNEAPEIAPAPEPVSAPIIPLPRKKGALDKHVPEAAKKVAKLTLFKPRTILKRLTVLSFVVGVLLPSLLGAYYFLFLASDRYAASAGFSVRTLDSTAVGGDFLGAITGVSGSGSTTTDSYIIMKYLTSREVVEKLIKDADFLKAYSSDDIDFLYRLDPKRPIEDVIVYWEWMITPTYDNTSGLIEFEVEAFTKEDAEKVAKLVVQYSQELVNDLSRKARREAVLFSQKEVSAAQLRLQFIREELRDYRATTKALDPGASATAQVELSTQIEQQLIALRAQLFSARGSNLAETSPTVRNLKRQIQALEKQLVLKRAEINVQGETANLSEILANFEKLQVEQEFAQQAYAAAFASLELSRANADKQQRFLAVYQQPRTPQDSIYPRRVLNSFLVIIVSLILWSVGLLLFNSVRDHMR